MRRQGNGGDLRPVAPLGQEGQHQGFKEDGSTKPALPRFRFLVVLGDGGLDGVLSKGPGFGTLLVFLALGFLVCVLVGWCVVVVLKI